MTDNYGYAKRGVEELKRYPHVCIGMDFDVVSGRPAGDPKDIPSLVDEDGIFINSRLVDRKDTKKLIMTISIANLKNR